MNKNQNIISGYKIRATFYAGNGESYVKKVAVMKDGKWTDHNNYEDKELVEKYCDNIIREHEHDDEGGTGYVIIENGKITENNFEKF